MTKNSLFTYSIVDIGKSSNQLIFYKLLGRKQFLALNSYLADKCNLEIIDNVLCKNLMFEICGPSVSLNVSRVAVYLNHFPSGTSVKNMVHFAQLVTSGK